MTKGLGIHQSDTCLWLAMLSPSILESLPSSGKVNWGGRGGLKVGAKIAEKRQWDGQGPPPRQ